MKEKQLSENNKAPNLGTATPKIIELFERALAERKDLKKWIEELSLKSNPRIRDRLCLALYRHQLSSREPPLPAGVSLTGTRLWQYSVSHPEEYRKRKLVERKILSYLKTSDELEAEEIQSKLAMFDLISADTFTYLALYPVVEEMFNKRPGRPVARPQVAVRALQLKIDTGRAWKQITDEVCDCGKTVHDEFCEANLCQSVRALRGLLKKCKI